MDRTSKNNLGANYSKIISAEDYDKLMRLHLYINQASHHIGKLISTQFKGNPCEVVDIGCGTGRVTQMISEQNPSANVYGVDADSQFLNYARDKTNPKIKYCESDILQYKHHLPVDVATSCGFHHHLSKAQTPLCLEHIKEQIKLGGLYIICDEFVSEYPYDKSNPYQASKERDEALVLWYCHIIGAALKASRSNKENSNLAQIFHYLAEEETKTLIDDLCEARDIDHVKSYAQLSIVLSQAEEIHKLIISKKIASAKKLSRYLRQQLEKYYDQNELNYDETMDLSRGDYKVCRSIFENEALDAGFSIESFKSFGVSPGKVGCLGVYVLKKPYSKGSRRSV